MIILSNEHERNQCEFLFSCTLNDRLSLTDINCLYTVQVIHYNINMRYDAILYLKRILNRMSLNYIYCSCNHDLGTV